MATLTVYPGMKPDGTRVSVVAEDLVTPIPNEGAVVTYSEYYAGLLATQELVTDNPVEGGPPPITILTAAVTVGGSPAVGRIVKATSTTHATWQDDTGGALSDGDVSAESQGAKFDNATESSTQLLNALETMANKGGRFVAPRTANAAVIANPLVKIGGRYSNIHVHGGTYKHNTNAAGAARDACFVFEQNIDPGAIIRWVDDVTFEHTTFIGNGADTDLFKAVRLGSGDRSAFYGCKLYDLAHEGLFWPGFSRWGKIGYSHAQRVGKKPGVPLSAFNIATDYAVLFASTAYDVGHGVEMGGKAAVIFGCIFDKCQRHALMLHSTGGANELGNFFGNVLMNAETGLFVADQATSIGKSLLHANVIYNCWKPVDVGSKPVSNQPYVVSDNFMLHGNLSTEAIKTHVGGHVIQGNTIARVTGTTTGAITSGTATLTVPNTLALMHSIAVGTTLTIAGVSGTKTVTAVSEDRATITLNSNADATAAPGSLVTFHSAKWAFVLRDTGNDYLVVKDNTIIGIPWSGTCFRFLGTRWTLTRNVFEPRGESYGSTPILDVLDVGGAIAYQLLATHMDVTKDWTISGTMQSVIYGANAPTVGTWKVGDVRYVWPPTAGGTEKEICTTAGTAGTAPAALTATTTIGSPNVTLAGGASPGEKIYLGCKIKIAGEYGGATVTVVSGLNNAIVVDTNATVGVAGASVTYSAPVWKAAGSIAP